jgi:hypothetical protein
MPCSGISHLFMKAPMRKQGDHAAASRVIGAAVEAARMIPRLAPGGLFVKTGGAWEVVVEPDELEQVVIVITAYKVTAW